MSRINAERLQLGIDALRSGKFTQGTGALIERHADGGVTHCCLGVLCEVYIEQTGLGGWEGHGLTTPCFSYEDDGRSRSFSGTLPMPVANWYGLERDPYITVEGVNRAATLQNDTMGRTFAQIADGFQSLVEMGGANA